MAGLKVIYDMRVRKIAPEPQRTLTIVFSYILFLGLFLSTIILSSALFCAAHLSMIWMGSLVYADGL